MPIDDIYRVIARNFLILIYKRGRYNMLEPG
jgi:hypothetical protein